MSQWNDPDKMKYRDSRSLFGDDTRSNCTVAEAKEYQQGESRFRFKRVAMVGLPILAIVLCVVAGIWYCDYYNEKMERQEAAREAENPSRSERVDGFEDAKFVMHVEGMSEETLPMACVLVIRDALGQKPSEVKVEYKFSGEMSPKPLPFNFTINGKSSLETVDDSGASVAVDLMDEQVNPNLLFKAVAEEWNRLYPDAMYPMVLEAPKPREENLDETPAKEDQFSNIAIPNDPRMTNPIQK